jgi:hypothetical protein
LVRLYYYPSFCLQPATIFMLRLWLIRTSWFDAW